MNLENIRALAFDVGGTVLDWRTGIIRDLTAWGKGEGMTHDWEAFADRWRTNSLDMALNAKQADFEMWSRYSPTGEPIRRQFPNPKRPKSSQQAAVEGLVKNLKDGSQPLCPGEFGRESLETGIGLRESHRRGGEKVELPLEDRTLSIGGHV